jgi:hypothetical protein
MADNGKAVRIEKFRRVLAESVFIEVVLWELPAPAPGSRHRYKYRLALVRNDACILRYDNERGKGDHRHIGEREEAYAFSTLETLLDDFHSDIGRLLK